MCSAHATSFAVSPDVIALDAEGHGIITLLNPGENTLHYAIEGIDPPISGYLLAHETEEIGLLPMLDTVAVRFEDGTGFGVMEIEIGVVRSPGPDHYLVFLASFSLLALCLAAKIYISPRNGRTTQKHGQTSRAYEPPTKF